LPVVEGFLEDRNCEHENKRCDVGEGQTNLKWWHKLTEADDQEEEVVEELELVEKYNRENCENVVLLIVLPVCHEGCWLFFAIKFELSLLSRDDPPHPSSELVAPRHPGLRIFLLSYQCSMFLTTAVEVLLFLTSFAEIATFVFGVFTGSNQSASQAILISVVFMDASIDVVIAVTF
jgi:hypothetical protein